MPRAPPRTGGIFFLNDHLSVTLRHDLARFAASFPLHDYGESADIDSQGRRSKRGLMDLPRERILVVDDDRGMTKLIAGLLRSEGYDVATAHDGAAGIEQAIADQPDVILCDVMMPGVDGFDVCRRLRANPRSRYICIILVTAKASSADKVAGLRAGADDFVTKPFDPDELLERIATSLRRTRQLSGLNPLTRLPGNDEIRRAIESRLARSQPFAVMHVDIDNFKAFNDHYGLLRGDAAIQMLADCLRDVAEGVQGETFAGHSGGDDMIFIGDPKLAEETAGSLLSLWDERVRDLYDDEDLERGYIEAIDRNGRSRRFSVMTLSVGIAASDRRDFTTHWQVSDIASRMKNIAKRKAASSYEIDRREGGLRVTEVVPAAELEYPPVDGNTVLVVDDNPMIREVLVLYCGAKGFNVVEAEDGVEAYRMTVQHRPAFVVLDYKMPNLDGRFAAELIREAAPDATIVALSAFLDSKPEWADAFIEKHQLHELPDALTRLRSRQTKSDAPGDGEDVDGGASSESEPQPNGASD